MPKNNVRRVEASLKDSCAKIFAKETAKMEATKARGTLQYYLDASKNCISKLENINVDEFDN